MFKILVVILSVLYPCLAFCQEVDKSFLKENLSKANYSIDLDAEEIILKEGISVEINYTNRFERKVRYYRLIKILKQSATDLADVVVDGDAKNVQATTYNLEGDNITQKNIDNNEVFKYKAKGKKGALETKFTLPGVKKGAILEYSYQIVEPLGAVLPHWQIQEEYPKLYSKYEIDAPNEILYFMVSQGDIAFKSYPEIKDAEKEQSEAYSVRGNSYYDNRYNVAWIKKNIKGMHSEPFVRSIENYRQRVDFQVAGTLQQTEKILTWKDLNRKLCKHEFFGWALDGEDNSLYDKTETFAGKGSDPLSVAKKIFSYVRNGFECSEEPAMFSSSELKNVIKSRRGSEEQLNLLLVAMLRHAKLDACPIILSKANEIKVDKDYPLLNRFNYVVCAVKIDNKRYLLDASGKFNSFGILPIYCYNGYARLINKEDGESLLLDAADITERDIVLASVQSINNNEIKINVQEKIGLISSEELRNKWKEDSSKQKTYITEQLQNFSGKERISGLAVENYDNPDTNLVITFTIDFPLGSGNVFYLDNQMVKYFSKNPFNESQRQLPIELPYKIDWLYIFSFQLPANLQLDDLPESNMLTYNGDELKYKSSALYDSLTRMLMIRTSYTTNKTAFPVEAYDDIKSFFEKMILESNKMIILKRNKS